MADRNAGIVQRPLANIVAAGRQTVASPIEVFRPLLKLPLAATVFAFVLGMDISRHFTTVRFLGVKTPAFEPSISLYVGFVWIMISIGLELDRKQAREGKELCAWSWRSSFNQFLFSGKDEIVFISGGTFLALFSDPVS